MPSLFFFCFLLAFFFLISASFFPLLGKLILCSKCRNFARKSSLAQSLTAADAGGVELRRVALLRGFKGDKSLRMTDYNQHWASTTTPASADHPCPSFFLTHSARKKKRQRPCWSSFYSFFFCSFFSCLLKTAFELDFWCIALYNLLKITLRGRTVALLSDNVAWHLTNGINWAHTFFFCPWDPSLTHIALPGTQRVDGPASMGVLKKEIEVDAETAVLIGW